MARIKCPITVIDPPTGAAVVGASVNITKRNGGAAATLYSAETGAGTTANPATTDAQGRVQAWIEPGSYNAAISGGGLSPYTEPLDLAPGVAPACRAYNSANIAVASSTFVPLTFDSERFDTDGIHSTSSNTDRFVAPIAGVYRIWCEVFWSGTGGLKAIRARLNAGGTTLGESDQPAGGNAMGIALEYALAAGDYVFFDVFQSSGGSLNINTGANYSPEAGISWIGAS